MDVYGTSVLLGFFYSTSFKSTYLKEAKQERQVKRGVEPDHTTKGDMVGIFA